MNPTTGADDPRDAAALAAAVLDAPDDGTETASTAPDVTDAELPGVDDQPMSLRDAVQANGARTLVVLGALGALQFMDGAIFNVLAPDIQRSLGISDAVLGAIGGATGVVFVLGAIPMASLSDRFSRTKLLAAVYAVWSVVILLTGAVQNALQMFLARLLAGMGQTAQLPVSSPLVVDTYPIQSRARVFAVLGAAQAVGTSTAPLIGGGLSALSDGGWRIAFVALGAVAFVPAFATLTVPEPRRGRHEMRSVLGEELAPEEDELPISLAVAFERLRKIRSFYYFLVGMGALGLALFSAPLFLNVFYDDKLGLSAFERGLVGTVTTLPALVAIGIASRRADALFRRSPPAAMVLIGVLLALFGAFITAAIWTGNVWTVVPLAAIALGCANAAFVILPAVVATLIPYRLRARGTALVGIYVFLFGAFFGAVLTGLLSDTYGTRTALTIVIPPATLIGGALIALGARHIRGDMAMVVEELREEQDERRRRADTGATTPVLQVRNLDFSYGPVQVLFGVDFDVREGETLALLGTNGAGKSTLLRVISGLGVADRGVIRLRGRTITYADPELRVRVGLVQLVGGRATFAPLTVHENLRSAAYLYDRHDRERRIDRALDLFPVLRERRDTPAGDLSGGQQQMLAMAMALVHEPDVLVIDELSLGLAPIVVQQVLEVVQRLRERGLTMVIVEQSLNVALSISDRALFMEKGRIRFEGPAAELAGRDDLARAVFLGPGADPQRATVPTEGRA